MSRPIVLVLLACCVVLAPVRADADSGRQVKGTMLRVAAGLAPVPDPACGLAATVDQQFLIMDDLDAEAGGRGGVALRACFNPVSGEIWNAVGLALYCDGSTLGLAFEPWKEVPNGCSLVTDHPVRATVTGGTGALEGLQGFFEIEYYVDPSTPQLMLVGSYRARVQTPRR